MVYFNKGVEGDDDSIRLCADEIVVAVALGIFRRIVSMFRRRKAQRFEPSGDGWATEIAAVGAELAVARRLGQYPTAFFFDGQVAETDVGRCQVRHSTHTDGHLIVYEEDRDDCPFILVVGTSPLRIVGGIRGHDCKRPEWWRAKGPGVKYGAYWVPQSALTPLKRKGASRE